MTRRFLLFPAILLAFASLARADGPIEVEPEDLAKRRDLIGKEVVVDDRINLFFPAPGGRGYNEIVLKRTTVPMVLPSEYIYIGVPTARAARVQGVLNYKDQRLVVDVTAKPELFTDDVKRIKKALAIIPAGDAESRNAWGDWAARRGAAFSDATLKEMADALHTEALAIEAARPTSRNPDALLAIVRKARSRSVPEPEPSALAHFGFRLKLGSAKTAAEFDKLAEEVSAFLPAARSAANANPKLKLDDYQKDPAEAYRKADPETRAALDRRLFTDAREESFSLRAAQDPKGLEALARDAERELPDRPDVAARLHERADKGVDIAGLREAEMLSRAGRLENALNRPEEARAMRRAWLDSRRKALSPTNAEDRVIYAEKYFSILKDKATAAELLREALKIEPGYADAVNLFQKMGYVKVDDAWLDPGDPAAKAGTGGGAADRPAPKDDALVGLTPSEVKAQLGAPTRVCRIATQGRISIQWVYESARGNQYIDFLHRSGDAQPSVIGHYSTR